MKILYLFIGLLSLITLFLWNSREINSKTQFVKINPILDKQHAKIFNAIDNLYYACKEHWDTEDKMYADGLKKMPPGHQNMSNEWEEHTNQHKALIDGILQMKQKIKHHIEKEDQPHFHWTK